MSSITGPFIVKLVNIIVFFSTTLSLGFRLKQKCIQARSIDPFYRGERGKKITIMMKPWTPRGK